MEAMFVACVYLVDLQIHLSCLSLCPRSCLLNSFLLMSLSCNIFEVVGHFSVVTSSTQKQTKDESARQFC